jgi:hypothetical protein
MYRSCQPSDRGMLTKSCARSNSGPPVEWHSYWAVPLRALGVQLLSLIQQGFEPGAGLVSSCPSGASLF